MNTLDELDDTGAVSRGLRSMVANAREAPTAPATKAEVARLGEAVDRLLTESHQERGARIVVRAVGGFAVTVIVALLSWGVTYAAQAARDHDRLDRVEHLTESLNGENTSRSVELAGSAARIDASLDRINELVTRIDRRVDGLDARITNLERRTSGGR